MGLFNLVSRLDPAKSCKASFYLSHNIYAIINITDLKVMKKAGITNL